jgi:hypothetical protein
MKKVILFLALLFILPVVICLSGCPTTPPITYMVGDTGPAGGLIFYDKGSFTDGWQYLEAAPSDQSAGTEWGCMMLTGADGTAVGTGEQNTIDIEAGCTEAGTAADICADLFLGGCDDWFLPSKDELNLMYENLKAQGLGDFGDTNYWSSSEYGEVTAWAQYFSFGYQYDWAKIYQYRVRAARAF